MPKSPRELLADLRAEPEQSGVLQNVIDDMLTLPEVPQDTKFHLPGIRESVQTNDPRSLQAAHVWLEGQLEDLVGTAAPLRRSGRQLSFDWIGGRRKSQTKRFGSCVKAVRKTVKARKGSTAEGAAIAICTTTLLHPRGRTLKRYRKGRLLTQKRRR